MPKTPERAAFGVYPQAGKRGRKPNAKSALEQAFNDERAMSLPQFGEVDLDVPTAANRAMGRRMVERDVDLKRQADRDMSPLEKLAGGIQTGRLIGSGLTQAVKSIPTAITKGSKAAEDYIAENIYQPNQPKAYEYAGDVADFLTSLETDYKLPPVLPEAVAIQSLLAPATRQAGKAVKQGAKQGALNLMAPRTLNPQAGVIKMKGGNWLGGSVEGTLKNLKRPDRMTGGRNDPIDSLAEMKARYTPEAIAELQPELRDTVLTAMQELEKKVALNNWVDRNLTNYVKKEMATPEDPVRRLAEEGIVHIPSDQVGSNRYEAPRHRGAYGGEQLGKSEAARAWEDASDVAINAPTARTVRANESLYQENPWTEKLSPDDRVYTLNKPGYREPEINSLGFDHILDVLREDVNAGRIRPEQLNKVSMEQAVRRTYEYDQELAAKVSAARAAQREGLPVYKEYPEGYRWVELNKPGSFASESEAMGHSVRGYEPPQGHPDWMEGSGDAGHLGYGHGGWEAIKSGKAKVYSLVDSKGQPHVTVESRAPNVRSNYDEMRAIENQAANEADAQGFTNFRDRDRFTESRVQELKSQLMAQKQPEGDYSITQIKGKGNAAPKEEYLPFVQDFVRSGKWSDVGDIRNTGLRDIDQEPSLKKYLEGKGAEFQRFVPEDEYQGFADDFLMDRLYPKDDVRYAPPSEGMARGGRVHFSDNPDVMQLELAGGGLVKGLKAAAKGMQNILPAAEREANKAKFLEQSKVPQRLYHGTTATEGGKGQEAIRRIKPSKEGALGSGVYLTPSPAHASGYSGIPNDEALAAMAGDPYAKRMADQFMADRASGTLREGQEGGNMLPVHAQMRNPLILEGKGDPMIEALVKLGMDEESASKMVERAYEQKGYIGKQVQQRAQAAGYDGLMQYRDGDLSEVVSYNPNAVKSAIGNQGTYDINDPDLNKAAGGAINMQAGGIAKAIKAAKAAKEAPMKASEALGRIEGRPLVITQADRTKVGGGFLGGPGFSGLQLEDPAYRAAEAAWAVKNPGTAKMILGGRGESKDAVYAAMLGTPTQHQSNQMVFDKLLGDFKKAAKKGGLDPELRDRINMRLANSVDKDGNNIFPPDVDILDKNFKDLASTFDRRSVTANLIGGMGVGGKKGQIIDYDKIIRQTTDPMLLESPTGALGNRLFTLSGGIIERPDLHPAFPTIMQGEDLGVSFDPVARNLIMKDFTEKTMREKGRAPGIFDYTRGYPPSQLITEDLLTELQKMGKKAGGAVRKAEGGEITADDLILEERKL